MNTGAAAKSFTLLIGPPRSGTTLIANTFMSHPGVSGVMEPFQRRRKSTIGSTDVKGFLLENSADLKQLNDRPNIAVKETTTRLANSEMSFALMRAFAEMNIYTGLILILRCPFTAFLSQVEASSRLWAERKLTEPTPRNFDAFMTGQRTALTHVTNHSRSQHYRVVSYEAFCATPSVELARLMALIPLRVHADQLQFKRPDGVLPGGDPKTNLKSGKIDVSDRSHETHEFMEMVKGSSSFRFAEVLRRIVCDSVCNEPESVVMDRLSRLMATGA